MSDEDLEQAFMDRFCIWGVREFPQYFERAGYSAWPRTPEDIADWVVDAYSEFEITNIKREIVVDLGKSVSGVELIGKGYTADVRRVSPHEYRKTASGKWEPYTGKDVAVIKIEGENLPSIILGDSDEMEVGDEVIAIGYPGAVVEHSYLAEETMFESSVTKGIISAKRKMPDGTPVLQTDAAITHGNSGGPALNTKGKAIGITTFGTGAYIGGEYVLISGFNFLVPSDTAMELLREINVENKQRSY